MDYNCNFKKRVKTQFKPPKPIVHASWGWKDLMEDEKVDRLPIIVDLEQLPISKLSSVTDQWQMADVDLMIEALSSEESLFYQSTHL